MKAHSNELILSQAASHLVDAYKACIAAYETVLPLELHIAPDAPESFEALQAEARNGCLRVTEAFSNTSIYGIAGNVTFRIFHDYGHILLGKKFTTQEEIELAQIQWGDLKQFLSKDWIKICEVVYFADTLEQSRFEAETGNFPANQKTFVMNFLNNYLEAWHVC